MTLSITTLDDLQQTVTNWRRSGDSIALVPTMGALHTGHLALVEAAKQQAKRVVVSIFVNPTQFGPSEDFSRYPRPLEKDLALLEAAGVDAAWLPTVVVMYPQGPKSTIHIDGLSEILEGAFRPGHFDGVATVVAALLSQVQPATAIFGEKDYQQLCLIKRLVKELNLKVRIIGVPTVREADGLALSSRNQYLSAQERSIAPTLYAVLMDTAQRIKAGDDTNAAIGQGQERLLQAGFRAIDYIAWRAEDTLEPATGAKNSRLLAAVHLGTTRLIDNIPVR